MLRSTLSIFQEKRHFGLTLARSCFRYTTLGVLLECIFQVVSLRGVQVLLQLCTQTSLCLVKGGNAGREYCRYMLQLFAAGCFSALSNFHILVWVAVSLGVF